MASDTSAPNRNELERRIADFPGVQGADLSGYPAAISVTVDPIATGDLMRELLRATLRSEFGVDPQVTVSAAGTPIHPVDRRSRFESIRVSRPEPGRFEARVELEWDGRIWEGTAEGVWNPASELRVCALAALRAVEKIIEKAATFSVVGAKELQVFDHSMVVLLVHSHQLPDPRLIGTGLIGDDRLRAAAIAALNATNRVVGRFVLVDEG